VEVEIMEKIVQELKTGKNAALAILTKCDGSSPGKEGFMLGVFEDGSTIGTLGGGAVEFSAITKAKECMKEGVSKSLSYSLGPDGNIGMLCGGLNEIYIKTFRSPEKLLIIGGGHIAYELFKLCDALQFKAVIFEDREEYGDPNRFPSAEIVLGDYSECLKNYPIDDKCYVVIVTKGHKFDQGALEAVVNSEAKYIGMIGSLNKTKKIMENLKEKGISENKLKRVFAPIGVAIGGETPAEIAISIISEILLVKNNGSLTHMKERLNF
jgi:xanthine dehydrogenase accessory factor